MTRQSVPQSVTFAYDGLTVRVDAHERTALAWLTEFLTPAFSVVNADTVDCCIEMIADDRVYHDILARGQRISRRFKGFMLDRGTVDLPVWAETPSERILYDRACRAFYCVGADRARVRLLSTAHHLPARFALMRVVREFAMNAAQSSRRLLIHGAAFATSAGGFILAGTKAAGKTSLLIHALRSSGARFVTNDRVLVAFDGTQPMLRGMPTVVTIRPTTLALFSDLRTRLLDSGYDHRLSLGEGAPSGSPTAPPKADRPIDLSPAQFCEWLSVKMSDASPLRAIFFPTVTTAHAEIRLRKLSPHAASERIERARFGPVACGSQSEVFTAPASSPAVPAGVRVSLSILAASVPCFECELGPRAYERGVAFTDLINRALPS